MRQAERRIEKSGLMSQTTIGVFCDNTEGHPNKQLADLGRVYISFFTGTNLIAEDDSTNTLRTLTNFHTKANPDCANSISYIKPGKTPIHFILPRK